MLHLTPNIPAGGSRPLHPCTIPASHTTSETRA